MSLPHGLEAMLCELQELATKGDAEYIIPTRAVMIGYEGFFHEYLRSYGTWLLSAEREADDLQAELPLLWLKSEIDGEPTFGETGLGILLSSFMGGPPKPQECASWMKGEDPGGAIRRSYCSITLGELRTRFPEFVNVYGVLFARSRDDTDNADVASAMGALLGLWADPQATVWLFCCSRENEPSVDSSEGLAAMAAHLQAKVKASGVARRFVIAAGNRAYRVLLDGAGYSVIESTDLIGLKRPMPPGVVWLRTGAASPWNTIDSKGFGVCLNRRTDAFSDFLAQFSNHSMSDRVIRDPINDSLGSLQTIMAGLCGFPNSKSAPGFPRNLNGQFFTFCRELSTKGTVSFWWLS